MHQNTVYNHIRRAEELLGGSVTERRVELQAALILAETLGPGVLPAALPPGRARGRVDAPAHPVMRPGL